MSDKGEDDSNPFAKLGDPSDKEDDPKTDEKELGAALNTALGVGGKKETSTKRKTQNSLKAGQDPPPAGTRSPFNLDPPQDVPEHMVRLKELKRAIAEMKSNMDLSTKRLEREDWLELEKDIVPV